MDNNSGSAASPSFDEAFRFIIKLGKAAHGYGSTANRLEAFLSHLAKTLGYEGVFLSRPSEIVFAIREDESKPQQVHVAAMPGTGLELNRLAAVGELVDTIKSGKISIADASDRLDEIEKIPHPWGGVTGPLSYALVGAGFAVLLSASWWNVLFAAILSVVVFGMVALSGRLGPWMAAWLPLSTAFVAGFLASLTQTQVPELNILLVTLCAILVLVPGFSISVGMVELVSNHVVSGTANLMSGLVYLAKQFIGAWLGVGMAGLFWTAQSISGGTPVDAQWLWLFMPLLIIGLCVVFQTAPRDFLWAFIGCVIAYGGILLGSVLVGGNLGNLMGAILAVIFANAWAAYTGRPTSIVLLPAIILLVSGSIGFRGLAAMAEGQTAAGEQQFLQMFVVALTIAAGLLVGHTLVRPRATL